MIETIPSISPNSDEPIWEFRQGRQRLIYEGEVYKLFAACLSERKIGSEDLQAFEEVKHRFGIADLVLTQQLGQGINQVEQVIAIEVKPWLNGVQARNAIGQAAAHRVGIAKMLDISIESEQAPIQGLLLTAHHEPSYEPLAIGMGVKIVTPVYLADAIAARIDLNEFFTQNPEMY